MTLDRTQGATYELAAPGRFTAHDLARVVADVAGREVIAEHITPEVFLRAALGVQDLSQVPYQTMVLRAIGRHYSEHDFVGNPNVLAWLLGRPPTTFEQFVRREFRLFEAAGARRRPNSSAATVGPARSASMDARDVEVSCPSQ